MKPDKVRNLTDEELRHQERDLNDQLFKLKFQLNMGQTESLKKIRGLRRDIARVKTIARERGVATGVTTVSTTEKKQMADTQTQQTQTAESAGPRKLLVA